jgi:hypothetical protein
MARAKWAGSSELGVEQMPEGIAPQAELSTVVEDQTIEW